MDVLAVATLAGNKIARTGLPASFAEALQHGASPTGD